MLNWTQLPQILGCMLAHCDRCFIEMTNTTLNVMYLILTNYQLVASIVCTTFHMGRCICLYTYNYYVFIPLTIMALHFHGIDMVCQIVLENWVLG